MERPQELVILAEEKGLHVHYPTLSMGCRESVRGTVNRNIARQLLGDNGLFLQDGMDADVGDLSGN